MAGSELYLGRLLQGMKESLNYSADKNAESASRLADLVAIEGASLPDGTTLQASGDYFFKQIIAESKTFYTPNQIVRSSDRTIGWNVGGKDVIDAQQDLQVFYGGNVNLYYDADPQVFLTLFTNDDITLDFLKNYYQKGIPKLSFDINLNNNIINIISEGELTQLINQGNVGNYTRYMLVFGFPKILPQIKQIIVTKNNIYSGKISRVEYFKSGNDFAFVESRDGQDGSCQVSFYRPKIGIGYAFNSPLVTGAFDFID